MAASSDDQCRALTQEGERCSRPAGEDGFCAQHDESDPTIEDRNGEDESDQSGENGNDQSDEDRDEESQSDDGEQSGTPASDIMSIREAVEAVGHDLIGHRIDGIIEVTRDGDGDGWRATVEVVERKSVPDTQDILGKYEIELDDDERVLGYRRIDRYRRDDTDRDEYMG